MSWFSSRNGKMRRFAVIGAGTFGSAVAETLSEGRNVVIVIDTAPEKVQALQGLASQAVQADATDLETLTALGVNEVDCAIVSLGEKIDLSILVTLHLKEMGVPEIVVKATTPEHGKILRLIGATEVVFPEKQMAQRVARRLSAPHVYDQISLAEDLSALEVIAPPKLVGKTLKDLRLRDQYHVNLIAVREPNGKGEMRTIIPKAEFQIRPGHILVVVGMDSDIEHFKGIK
jgi:trk/ktr system potassium uptake protein